MEKSPMKKTIKESNVSSRVLWLVLVLLPISMLFFLRGGEQIRATWRFR
jgi:hypothetical protein